MSLHKLFYGFRPDKKGLSKVLGELEAEVMEVVWQKGSVSVRDVYDVLRSRRQIAYTTVMTIMGRLADKQLLAKEKQGLAYIYTPVYSKSEFTRSLVQEVIDGLLEDYSDLAFAHFIGRLKEDDEAKLAELEKLIQDKLQKGE